MEDYKKDIIMVYHIPVDGMTIKETREIINDFMKSFKTGEFFRELFLPKTNSVGKIDIEVINLKNNKTEQIQIKIEDIDDKLMKYFEHDRWIRKEKLKRILR